MEEIIIADLANPTHAEAMLGLLHSYALDPMGGGEGLSEFAQTHLISALQQRSGVYVVLAWRDAQAVGLAICFEGFSTFACQPLLNIHDVVVLPAFRGQGISKRLLAKVETIARELGCCKLTLEVLEGNHVAQAAYRACGFSGYELQPDVGKALFWQKKLSA